MSKLFKSASAIGDAIEELRKGALKHQENRALIAGWVAGVQPIMPRSQSAAMGLTVDSPTGMSRNECTTAKDQLLALHDKPPRLWNVGLDYAPAGKRESWGQQTTEFFSRTLKKHNRFRPTYAGTSGDAAVHGLGCMFRFCPRSPIPRHLALSQLMVPEGTPADVDGLEYFSVEGKLRLDEINYHIRHESPGWKLGNLRKLREFLFRDEHTKQGMSGRAMEALRTWNPEEMEYARQEHATLDKIYRNVIAVDYFYQANPDKDERPLTLTVRLPAGIGEGTPSGKWKEEDLVLFEEEDFFDSVKHAIMPFFMDCRVGGPPAWNRVMGLGAQNYNINYYRELFMCRMAQGAMESSIDLWRAGNSSQIELLEQFRQTQNGILPEGVDLVQTRRNFDASSLLSVFNAYSQQGAKNAMSAISNSGQQDDLLEIQAQFQQNQVIAQQSARLATWYDAMAGVGASILEVYTDPDLSRHDRYYSEAMEFRGMLQRAGIPLYYVQRHNVSVTSYKVTGDGDQARAVQSANFTLTNLQQIPPEFQRDATRDAWGTMVGFDKAEAWFPRDAKPPADQIDKAEGENNTAILQGRPRPLGDGDVDEVHLPIHFQGLQSLLQQAEQNGAAFTPQMDAGFVALGGHAQFHIQKMEQEGKKDQARAAIEMLQNLARMADRARHNMQQQMDKEQVQGDPDKAADRELKAAQLELQREKLALGQQNKDRSQAERERQADMREDLQLQDEGRKEERHRFDMVLDDAAAAAKVRAANKPQAATV